MTLRHKVARRPGGWLVGAKSFQQSIRVVVGWQQPRPSVNPKVCRIVPESSEAVRVASWGTVGEMEALFKAGLASPNDKSEEGWTLLMVGTYLLTQNLNSFVSVVHTLTGALCPLPPLKNSAYYGSPDMVRLLVRSGADVSARELPGEYVPPPPPPSAP